MCETWFSQAAFRGSNNVTFLPVRQKMANKHRTVCDRCLYPKCSSQLCSTLMTVNGCEQQHGAEGLQPSHIHYSGTVYREGGSGDGLLSVDSLKRQNATPLSEVNHCQTERSWHSLKTTSCVSQDETETQTYESGM